jgi:toxin CcdB
MVRFEVYRLTGGAMAVDCQAGFLSHIGTQFVIPLSPRGTGARANPRINPEFEIKGKVMVLVTQLASTIVHLNSKAG